MSNVLSGNSTHNYGNKKIIRCKTMLGLINKKGGEITINLVVDRMDKNN
jgi:hypothetical protein